MKFMFSKKNLLVKVFVVLILVALLISINPVVVHAWKTRSHVYSANLILEELELNEKDGKYYVTIDPFGKFEVPKEFSDALFEYPDAFRAGTIGPDLFPDMLTGQTLIHTYDDFRMISSGDWLNHLVNSVNQLPKDSKERKEALAFTLGFMAHYAGDMFGHDFVNSFADGKFPSLSQFDGVSKAVEKDLADRIVKHMAFETYMDALVPSDYVVGEKNDVSAPVRFMLDTMYYAGGPNNGTSQILKRYEELPSTLSYLVEFRYKLFTLAEDARYVYEAFTEMFVAYVDCWIADLDEAVEQLVFSFNRIAMNLAGKPKKAVVLPDHTIGYVDKTDFEVIEEEMRDWFWYYGIYASPFPDVVGALLSFPVIVVDKLKSAFNISEAESGYDQFKDTLLDPAKIILGSIITGLSYSNVERIKNIDPEDPLASFEEGTDKYEIEAILKTFGTGVRDGKLIEQPTAQNQEFEPFYNTLQMIKLVLIGPDGYSKLLNQFPSYGKNTVYKMNSGEFKTTRIKLDIKTKDVLYAGTDANIWCCVRDREAKQSVRKLLDISAYNDMERGDLDTYFIELNWFASVENLEIWFESSGINDDWNIGYVKATPMNGSVELMTKNIISDFILKKDDKTPSSKITSNSYTYTTNLSSGILDYIETLDGSEQWDAKNNILYSNVGFRRNIFNRIFKGFENEIYQVDNSYDESTDKLAFEVFLLPKRNGLYETDRYSSTHRKLPAPTGKVRVYVEDKVQPSGKRYIGAYSVSKTNDIPDGIDLTPNPFSYIKDPLKYKVLRNLKMFYKSSFTVSSPKAGNAVYYFEYEGDDNYSASYYETTVHVGKYKVDHVEEAAMYYGSSTKISIANRSTNGKELDIEYRIKNDEYNVFSVVSGTERYYNPFAGMVTIKADYDERAVADLDYQATLELYDKLSKKTLSSIVLKASLDRITDFSRINLIKKNNVVLPNDLSNTIDIEVGDILQIKGQNLVKHQNDNFYYAWKITERGRNIHYIEDDAADRKFIFSDTGTYDIDYVQYYIKENKAFNITTNSIVVNVYAGHLITKNVSVNPYFDTYNDYYQGGVLPEIKFNVYENGTLINAEDIEYTYINMNESLHNVYKIVDEEGNPVDALTPGTYKCAPTKGYYYETIVYNKKTNVSYIYNISYSEITINVKDGTVDENKNKGSIHRLPGYTSDLFDELKIVHISNDSGIIPYPPVGFTICDGLGRKIAISEGKTNKAVFPSGFFFSDLNINSYGARLFIPYPEGTSMKDEFIQYIKWNEQTRKFATVAEFSDDPNMLIEKTRYGLLLFVMEEFSYELAVSNSHRLTLRDINGLELGVTTDEYAYSSIVTLKRKDSSLIFNNWVVPNDVEILSGTLKSDEIKIKMPNKDIVIDCIYSDNVPVRFETIGGGNAHTVEGVSNFYQLPECMFLVPSGKYLSYWRDKDSNELYRAGDYVNIDHLHTFETVWDDVEAITSLDIRTTKDIAPVAEANISLASSVDELYDLLNRNSLFTICGDLTTDNYWALSNNSYYGPLTDTSIQFMPSSSYRLALKLKPSSRYTFDRLYVNNYTLNGVGCCSYIDNGD